MLCGDNPFNRRCFAARCKSFHTACRVRCFHLLNLCSNTKIFPDSFKQSSRSVLGSVIRRFFPVFSSVTVNRSFCTCSVFSASTSPILSPVVKLTMQASRFGGVSAMSIAFTLSVFIALLRIFSLLPFLNLHSLKCKLIFLKRSGTRFSAVCFAATRAVTIIARGSIFVNIGCSVFGTTCNFNA